MCGIIGYIGEGDVAEFLVKGLKRLEYRGYDSAGISLIAGGLISTVKCGGNISKLEKKLEKVEFKDAKLGIGHTRWATHGEPTDENAHPHTSCKDEIAIAHNGIIENYKTLKKMLMDKGHAFKSDTDSEVIAHLIEEFYDGDLESAVARAVKSIEGAYAIASIHKSEDRIVVACKSSPIVIGFGDGAMFIASDAAALVGNTNKVVYLSDGEIASVMCDRIHVRKLNGESVNKQVKRLDASLSDVEKGGFKHFMLKEIFEQPESLSNLIRGRVRGNSVKLTLNVNLNSVSRIIIIACGTSWHSAIIGKYIIENLIRVPVEVDYASEFKYRNPIIGRGDLVIAISQSGETADTIGAVRAAKQKGARVIGIVNVVGSTISREVDGGIYLRAGPEISVASTKAFTSQVLALLLFALYARQARGGVADNQLLNEITDLPNMVDRVLDNAKIVERIAEDLAQKRNFLYLGRGINYPVALEGALKLKEISYIHAEGYPAGEMKHGPIALIDEGFPVVFISPKDGLYDKVVSNMEEVKARKAIVIAVINEIDENVRQVADYIIEVPKTSPLVSPIINVIPLQLLAYYIADLKGVDVDRPRNLAKSVTVE